MQPLPDQMMGNRERMRGEQPIGVLALVHQGELGAVEPARLLELGAIHDDILVERARRASNHQR
jgi:hypothetical protein